MRSNAEKISEAIGEDLPIDIAGDAPSNGTEQSIEVAPVAETGLISKGKHEQVPDDQSQIEIARIGDVPVVQTAEAHVENVSTASQPETMAPSHQVEPKAKSSVGPATENPSALSGETRAQQPGEKARKVEEALEPASAVPEPVSPAKVEARFSGQLWSCVSKSDGSVAVVFPAVADETPYFWFESAQGEVSAARPATLEFSDLAGVNLLRTSEEQAQWRILDAPSYVRLGKNTSPDWTLQGQDTHYITSAAVAGAPEAAAVLCNPAADGPISLASGQDYVFSILAAGHRCHGRVEVEILSVAGDLLSKYTRHVDQSRLGGRTADLYDNIEIDFTAPAGAFARISVIKGRTTKGDDSYLFFARPSLAVRSAAGVTSELSRDLLKHLASKPGMQLRSARLPVPASFFLREKQPVTLVAEIGGQRLRLPEVELKLDAPVNIDRFALQNRDLLVHGARKAPGGAEIRLGVFVDGELSVESTIAGDEFNFARQLSLDARHLDGRPHEIELRLMPGQFCLAQTFGIVSHASIPWLALRQYSRAPFLTLEASPAAPHHLRSYRAWADNNGKREAPPLAQLHSELLQGFQKRAVYPPLAFEAVAAPKVSVIIPVRDKFEVTYYCLCALLFAFNDASFEVIVVDDGSTDTTVKFDQIVSGAKLVRHEKSLGFVDACNDGAAVARGEYLVFLNNDTEVTAGWLDALTEVFEKFDNVGLAGSKLLYPDGRLQEAGGIVWRSGNPWNVGRGGNPHEPQFSYLRQVDYISGAALMIPSAVWREVGCFSAEMAPGYFEDTDLAMKVRASGRYVVFAPNSIVFHYEGQSSGTSTDSGMKRFQEVNRPKFKRKWMEQYRNNGVEGVRPDREKDRNITFRVLMLDHQIPQVDTDAGSYAAFQEIRLLQSMGAKVTFLPHNLVWLDRHTATLEAVGVECLHAPFVTDIAAYLAANAKEYDLIYITRFQVADQFVSHIRRHAPAVKIVLNLADLHFLRELREAKAGSALFTLDRAKETREVELRTIESVDLTLSYTDVEISVIESHLAGSAKVTKLPWVAEVNEEPRPAFSETKDIVFLGGFGHYPNRDAVKFFANMVMPHVAQRLPGVRFRVAGSLIPEEIFELESDSVEIVGFAPELKPLFVGARIFVAPLIAGAGIKGKVIEALTHGTPSVLSPVAAEGIGVVSGHDCLIAHTVDEWVDSVVKLYTDEALWNSVGQSAKATASTHFSFATGQNMMRGALAQVDIFGASQGLHHKRARP